MSYSIGIDFGTASGRVILADTSNGHIISRYEEDYANGTYMNSLYDKPLPENYFLQNADDYLQILEQGVQFVLEDSKVNKNDVVGIGVDFTSSTIIFLDEQFEPLHRHEDLKTNPHAYVKLWKHHGAQDEANYMIQMSKNKNWLDYYGSSVNSEWMIPKILEVKHEAPEILRRARYIMEAGDYITSILTNSNIRSNCGIGFKGFGTMKLDLITTSSIAWILIYLKSSKKNVKRQSYQLEKVQVVYVKTINKYGAFSRCPGFTFYHRCTFWRLRCWGNRSWRIHCSHWYKYLSSHARFKTSTHFFNNWLS